METNGQLLWNRALIPAQNTSPFSVAHQLVQQDLADQDFDDSLQIIPQTPHSQWTDITSAAAQHDRKTARFAFSSMNVNQMGALFLEPHSVIGPGNTPRNGQELWANLQASVDHGAVVDVLIPLTERTIRPEQLSDIHVIPLAPLSQWVGIIVTVNMGPNGPRVQLANTNLSGTLTPRFFLWLPSTEVGPGHSDPYDALGGDPAAIPGPAVSGQFLWSRRNILLPSGTTNVQTGIEERENTRRNPDQLTSVQVIALPPIGPWLTNVSNYSPIKTGGRIAVPMNSTGEGSTVINVLFLLPHTVMGPGIAAPYSILNPPG